MNICFAVNSFFPDSQAGTEQYVLALSRYLIKKGWTVSVVLPSFQSTKDYVYEDINIYTFIIPEVPDKKALNGLIPPEGISGFLQIIKQLKPDLVHFHTMSRAINHVHLSSVRDLGIPVVLTPHLAGLFCVKGNLLYMDSEICNGKVTEYRCLKCTLNTEKRTGKLSGLMALFIMILTRIPLAGKFLPAPLFRIKYRKTLLNQVSKKSNLIFAIGPWIKETFKLNRIDHVKLIPQGINPAFLRKSVPNTNIERPLNFCFIGRMHPYKGFHHLSKAFDNIDPELATLHVIVSKERKEEAYFEAMKQWADSRKNVTWNENLNQESVVEFIDNMDMLILPSESNEMAPLVILEAFSRSVPVIGSNFPAISDLVEHEINGLLFNNGDWNSLYSQIHQIVMHPDLLGDFRRNIQTPQSIDTVAAIIESEYLEILDKYPVNKF